MDLEPRGLGPRLSEFTQGEETNIFVNLKNGCVSDWDDWVFDRMFRYVEAYEQATHITENNISNITRQIKDMEEYNDRALNDRFDELKSELGYKEDIE